MIFVLLPLTAVLPGSDAGNDGVTPASSFVIQKTVKPHAPCGARRMGHVKMWSAVCLMRCTRNLVKERDLVCAWTNGIVQQQPADD